METNEHDKIEEYLLDQLTSEEESRFRESLEKDGDRKKETALARQIVTAFDRKNEKESREALRQLSPDELRNLIFPPANRWKRAKPLIYLAAVAATLACVIWGTGYRYSSEALFNDFYTAETFEMAPTRGDMPSREQYEQMSQAAEAYNRLDFRKAITLLKSAFEGRVMPPEAKYYLARGYIHTRQYADAQILLQELANEESIYAHDAQWNLALLYTKQNKREKAREIVTALATHDTPYKTRALELLTKLNTKRWF